MSLLWFIAWHCGSCWPRSVAVDADRAKAVADVTVAATCTRGDHDAMHRNKRSFATMPSNKTPSTDRNLHPVNLPEGWSPSQLARASGDAVADLSRCR